MNSKKCRKCKSKDEMVLIQGDWGKWLDQPYWKCLKCGLEIEEKRIKKNE